MKRKYTRRIEPPIEPEAVPEPTLQEEKDMTYPAGTCQQCGDKIAEGQTEVCAKHIRVG